MISQHNCKVGEEVFHIKEIQIKSKGRLYSAIQKGNKTVKKVILILDSAVLFLPAGPGKKK